MVKFHRKDINTKGVISTKLLGLYFISLEVVLTIPINKMSMSNTNFSKIKPTINCVSKKTGKKGKLRCILRINLIFRKII